MDQRRRGFGVTAIKQFFLKFPASLLLLRHDNDLSSVFVSAGRTKLLAARKLCRTAAYEPPFLARCRVPVDQWSKILDMLGTLLTRMASLELLLEGALTHMPKCHSVGDPTCAAHAVQAEVLHACL